jgi:hypothetical protein
MIAWVEGTALAAWVRESPSIWAYPTVLALHTVGLAIVVGASTVVDVRLLGFAPRIRVGALAPLFPLLWAGFALNAATGLLLFIADATTKSHQPVFYVKLVLIAFALWFTLGARNAVVADRASIAPTLQPGGTRIAGLSLLLWAGAIAAGRLMAYL